DQRRARPRRGRRAAAGRGAVGRSRARSVRSGRQGPHAQRQHARGVREARLRRRAPVDAEGAVTAVATRLVKVVVWDLDGTLWPGVALESDGLPAPYPAALAALDTLAARGILGRAVTPQHP